MNPNNSKVRTNSCGDDSASDDGCPPPPEVIFEDEFMVELELVEVTGFRQDDSEWATVCSGDACQDIQFDGSDGDKNSWLEDAVVDWTDVAELKQEACSAADSALIGPVQQQRIRDSTSHSDEADRNLAAYSAAQASGLLTRLTAALGHFDKALGYAINKGYTIEMTFSDGGTEQYKYIAGSPSVARMERVAGTLKQGNGQSRCPSTK
ncbi:hypothetical protein [Roseateles oligotrophus]|uniref:Uncharacterized protein n=1 Tax=Roseateles oligotrophus TaxID=1769250 RepID=A0ABT2YF59_9BURK|nr:hypothetical protein [Roseateles oligotrophus]MCV2368620.1 hypothetical protein [Roseateles oligotrophus]